MLRIRFLLTAGGWRYDSRANAQPADKRRRQVNNGRNWVELLYDWLVTERTVA